MGYSTKYINTTAIVNKKVKELVTWSVGYPQIMSAKSVKGVLRALGFKPGYWVAEVDTENNNHVFVHNGRANENKVFAELILR